MPYLTKTQREDIDTLGRFLLHAKAQHEALDVQVLEVLTAYRTRLPRDVYRQVVLGVHDLRPSQPDGLTRAIHHRLDALRAQLPQDEGLDEGSAHV